MQTKCGLRTLFANVVKHSRLRLFERAHGLADLGYGELVARFEREAVGLSACILDVGAGAHRVARDPFDHGAELLAEQFRALRENRVKAGEIQQIADLDIRAVLLDLGLDLALREALARSGGIPRACRCCAGCCASGHSWRAQGASWRFRAARGHKTFCY